MGAGGGVGLEGTGDGETAGTVGVRVGALKESSGLGPGEGISAVGATVGVPPGCSVAQTRGRVHALRSKARVRKRAVNGAPVGGLPGYAFDIRFSIQYIGPSSHVISQRTRGPRDRPAPLCKYSPNKENISVFLGRASPPQKNTQQIICLTEILPHGAGYSDGDGRLGRVDRSGGSEDNLTPNRRIVVTDSYFWMPLDRTCL